MKKRFYPILLTLVMLPALAACRKPYDYSAHISEARSDLFLAQTEEFRLTLSCVEREYPYASDGVACPSSMLVEISLVPVERETGGYEIYVLPQGFGGEASFRNTRGDYFYSQGVSEFPAGSVTLKIVSDSGEKELTATSVKNEHTLSVTEALSCAVKAEPERIGKMTRDGKFFGEFYVRLLRRDTNYYYVGIIDENGNTLSLLLDGETGEVKARREQ